MLKMIISIVVLSTIAYVFWNTYKAWKCRDCDKETCCKDKK